MRRVYVVDDDESLRKALSFVLKGLDCDPVPYPSAEHFLTYVPHNEPGIVLLDVRMGQMTPASIGPLSFFLVTVTLRWR